MKLLTRAQFLELPEGVFYAKNPQRGTDGVTSISLVFEGLSVKGETCRHTQTGEAIDWWSCELNMWDWNDSTDIPEQWDQLRKGASLPLIEGWSRDGLFDEDDLFLVYERTDLEALAKLVQAALAVTP